ncbi:MAG: FUSC family protein [Prochlorococcaceae cyanobacterium]
MERREGDNFGCDSYLDVRIFQGMKQDQPIRIPFLIAVATLVAYVAGFWFTSLFPGYLPKIGGLWSAISAIVVTQITRRDTFSSASLRILGSAIGAITSAIYLTLLPFHPLGMAAAIFVTVLLCMTVKIPGHARLAAITVIVVMVTSSLDPRLNPGLNALLRFAESCIGTAVAVALTQLWHERTDGDDQAPDLQHVS